MDGTRYRTRPYDLQFVGQRESIIVPDQSTPRILSIEALRSLALCNRPATLDQHIRAVAQGLGFFRRHEAVTLIRELRETHLLFACDSSEWDWNKPAPPSRKRQVDSIVIFTADRPYVCLECIRTLLPILRESPEIGLVVIDGGKQPHNRSDVRRQVAELTIDLPNNARYIGQDERATLCDSIIRKGFSPDMVQWALLEAPTAFSVGSARNVMLLTLPEHALLSLDDDVKFDLYAPQVTEAALWFCDRDRPRFLMFSPSRDRLIQTLVKRVSGDLLDDISRMLGGGAGLAFQWPSGVNIDSACMHQISSLTRNSVNVPLLHLGLVGDSALNTGDWFSMLGNNVQNSLCQSDESCALSISSREVINIADRVTVSHDSHCMTVAVIMDNSHPLPPFPARFRNEDGVFGSLLTAGSPDTYFGHLPFGILHDAPRGRRYAEGTTLRMADILVRALEDIRPCFGSDPWLNYALFGQYLRSAATDAKTLNASVSRWMLGAYAVRLEFIDNTLPGIPKRSLLHRHLTSMRDRISSAVSTGKDDVPLEMYCSEENHDRFSPVGSFLRSYGELLVNWRPLNIAAREIAASQ